MTFQDLYITLQQTNQPFSAQSLSEKETQALQHEIMQIYPIADILPLLQKYRIAFHPQQARQFLSQRLDIAYAFLFEPEKARDLLQQEHQPTFHALTFYFFMFLFVLTLTLVFFQIYLITLKPISPREQPQPTSVHILNLKPPSLNPIGLQR